jgi:hypothetical protein
MNSYFSQHDNDSLSTLLDVNWVTPFAPLGLTPDYRLNSGSVAATGADFSDEVFGGISTVNELTNKITLYPNPTSSLLYVDEISELEVINQNGQLIIKSKTDKLDLSNLVDGIYYVKVNNLYINKIVIKK